MDTLRKAKEEALELLKAASHHDVEPSVDQLQPAPDLSLGDLAFGCFPLSKALKKDPAGVAKELAEAIDSKLSARKGDGFIAAVEASGPYLNFRFDYARLASEILDAAIREGASYGTDKSGALTTVMPSADTFLETKIESFRNVVPGRAITHQVTNIARGAGRIVRQGASKVSGVRPHVPLVMVEVCSPNTHKELHVGHVRNILLGRAIAALRRAIGEQVITSSYPGDAGAHVAKSIWALEKFHKGEKVPKEKGRYLAKIYTEASRYLDEHPEAKKEVEAVQQKLEAGDKKLVAIWKKTREWSLDEIKSVFAELGVPVRRFYFESEMERPGKRMVADLLKKGIAKKSQGATIVDLEDQGLGAFLIMKTDGTTLYATKDLALAKRKFTDYPLDLSICIVDSRQTLYFKQLFAALKRAGFEKPMVHLPFEFVTLKEGAMSSRAGNVVTYEDLRDEMVAKTMAETGKRHKGWSKAKIEATAKGIAIGAMAVGMLKQDTDRQIVFDMDEALAFEGFTGPYLQYSLARIKGIAKKAGRNRAKVASAAEFAASEERALIMDLARYPELVRRAAREYKPSLLVSHLFETAKHFAEFYERVPVLKAPPEQRAARLKLVKAVGAALESGFIILGIPAIGEM